MEGSRELLTGLNAVGVEGGEEALYIKRPIRLSQFMPDPRRYRFQGHFDLLRCGGGGRLTP